MFTFETNKGRWKRSINSPSLALAQNEETQNGESDNKSFTLIKIHSSIFTDHNHSNGTMRTL